MVSSILNWETSFIAETSILDSATKQQKTLLVPDKDADGLDAGVIVYRTLMALGLSETLIDVHFLRKGRNIHDEDERAAMHAKQPKYVIVLDQGSRGGRSVVDGEEVKVLVLDHHYSDEFPEGALVCPLPDPYPLGYPRGFGRGLCGIVIRSSQRAIPHPSPPPPSSPTKSANPWTPLSKPTARTCVR